MKRFSFIATIFSICAALISQISVAAPNCDKAGAKKLLTKIQKQGMARVTTEDGWQVWTFGSDYYSWTPRQTEGMINAIANTDACVTGKARKLEFRAPGGKLVGRARDGVGITVYKKNM